MPLIVAALLLVVGMSAAPRAAAESGSEAEARTAPEGAATEPPAAVRLGRQIWMSATGGNADYFAEHWPLRQGGRIDWYAMLAAERRPVLFRDWGALASPDCCVPGAPDCPAKTAEETWGFAWCEGDDALLGFVGRTGYPDPACELGQGGDCALAFGTSAGAVGFRKFPNPRFDPARWAASAGWEDVGRDPGLEPPFRIGLSCAACHAGPDPLNPPGDPARPGWDEIDPLAGNPWHRVAALLATGAPAQSRLGAALARARPGTSPEPVAPLASPLAAVQPLIDPAAGPLIESEIVRWRPVEACPPGSPEAACRCDASGCRERAAEVERVPSLLAGGEDTIGLGAALGRAWLAQGACAADCVLGNLPGPGLGRPGSRDFAERPVDPAQCQRDCPAYGAFEDRLDALEAFVATGAPAPLWQAQGLGSPRDLEIALDAFFHEGAVEEGRALFVRTCARCHSSQRGPWQNADFAAGEDRLTNAMTLAASEIGTHRARAARTLHAAGRLWAEFAPAALAARPADPGATETTTGGGRGHLAVPSLRSAWTRAPFLHENAVGPELCDGSVLPYVGPDTPGCVAPDPSVEGRFRLYVAAMEALLGPERRVAKMPVLDRDLTVELVPGIDGPGLVLTAPKGLPVEDLGALRLDALVTDLGEDPLGPLPDGMHGLWLAGVREVIAGAGTIREIRLEAGEAPARLASPGVLALDNGAVQRFYSESLDRIENTGHRFGESLSEREKKALIAFVATL